MVVGALPLAKVSILAIRQVSKPFSNFLKNAAKEHPLIRKHICIPPGRAFNWLEVRSKMYMMSMNQPTRVPPLTDAMATEVGANLLGELIVLAIGLGLIYFEVSRQALNDQKKHEKQKAEREELRKIIGSLKENVNYQAKEIERLNNELSKFEE